MLREIILGSCYIIITATDLRVQVLTTEHSNLKSTEAKITCLTFYMQCIMAQKSNFDQVRTEVVYYYSSRRAQSSRVQPLLIQTAQMGQLLS